MKDVHDDVMALLLPKLEAEPEPPKPVSTYTTNWHSTSYAFTYTNSTTAFTYTNSTTITISNGMYALIV